MDISNAKFLQYTTNQPNGEVRQRVNVVSENNSLLEENASCVPVEGEISVANIGSVLTDEAIENILNTGHVGGKFEPTVKLSTTYKNFSPSEISNIKQLIYNIHHPENSSQNPDNPGTIDPVDPDNPGIIDNPDDPSGADKKSFISAFCDADTLFEYMHSINPSITKDTGVTRAQLIEYTQNDDWEDSNYDFFGSLNRIFNLIDEDSNSKLSFAEIENFIGEELGESFINYKNKVNLYCDEIQEQYAALSNQKKLEFAIARTEEYLSARNMTRQLDALNRLKGQTDLYNTIKVGQIAIANLNQGNTSNYITLGSYTYWAYTIENYNNGVNVGNVDIYAYDRDNNDGGYDLGITLDISLLSENWYILVNTLVHELTHATAYQYYSTDEEGGIPKTTLTKLYNQGAMTETEYNWYMANWNRIVSPSTQSDVEKLRRLDYLTSCVWGEYAAYQADADYNDSIGQDVYKRNNDDSTTAVNGANEKSTIINHIAASYDGESIPDYKWWSYA